MGGTVALRSVRIERNTAARRVRVAPDQKTGVTSQLVWAFQLLQVLAVGEAGRKVT